MPFSVTEFRGSACVTWAGGAGYERGLPVATPAGRRPRAKFSPGGPNSAHATLLHLDESEEAKTAPGMSPLNDRGGTGRGRIAGQRAAIHLHTLGRSGRPLLRGWLRRGEVNYSVILLGLAVSLLIGAAVWFSWRQAADEMGEPELHIPMICAECGHSFTVSYEGLLALGKEARQKGAEGVGDDLRKPAGFCPKCGKLALYRAGKDRQTGKLMLPESVAGQ